MVVCLVWFCECQFELMDLSISDLLQSISFVMLVLNFGHLCAVGVYSGWVLSLLHILLKSWLVFCFFFNVFFFFFGFWCDRMFLVHFVQHLFSPGINRFSKQPCLLLV